MRLPLTGLPGRVFVGTALIVLAVLAASLLATTATIRRTDEAEARRRLEQDADFVAHLLAGRERSLAGGARVFAQSSNFRATVAKPNTPAEDMFDRAFEASQLLDASWVFITDARGRVLAKSDEPSALGADFGDVPLVAGALRGQMMSGFGVSRDSLLFQAVAVPIPGPSPVAVGVLVATSVVDAEVLRDARATTGSEVLFYAIGADGRTRVTASSLARSPSLDSAVAALGASRRASMLTIGGTRYHAQGATATTAGGDAVGGWFVLRAHDGEPVGVAGMREALAAAALVGLALALGAATLAARRVTRPIRALADAARKAADVPELDADASDEIAALGSAFHAVLADLRDREALTALGPLGTHAALASPPAGEPAPATRALTRGALRLDPRGDLAATAPQRRERLAERYELEVVVGSGGSGIVWRARDHALGEIVAVKMLRPELLVADALGRERLTHEIRLARRISHRNVVRIHDFAEHGDVPFLTMEFVDGPSLQAMLGARGPLPTRAVLAVGKQLLRALDVAHGQGVVHGDLKPANLLVAPGGVLKVSDFGVARLMRAPVGPDASRLAGATVGTPEYMAPEILLGRAPDVRADMYAAGVVLHECLTGETPFHADTPIAFFARKLDDGRPAPHEAPARPSLTPTDDLAASLGALVMRMTDADPSKRPGSARECYAILAAMG